MQNNNHTCEERDNKASLSCSINTYIVFIDIEEALFEPFCVFLAKLERHLALNR